MDPYYEYILYQQEQLITLSSRATYLRSLQDQRFGTWGKFIDKCGDVLINFGSWMKRVSNSSINENSVGVYTQN